MKTDALFLKPEEYVIQVTVTMTVGEWEELIVVIPEKWPSSELRRQVRDVIHMLRRRVGIHDNMETSL